MQISDVIADMLTRIRNANSAKHETVDIPASNMKKAIADILLTEGYIKGSVGAGDAFCAGCLYGIYNGFSDKDILEFASGAAACNLAEADSVSGMQNKEYILDFIAKSDKVSL